MRKWTRAFLVMAALAVAGSGVSEARAADPVPTDDWIRIMEIKVKAVDLQNKGAALLAEAETQESLDRIQAAIDDAKLIFQLAEARLRGL